MKNQCSLLINFSKLYEMNSKITPGLTNHQSQPFFAIGIIPLPKVLFLNCLRHHLCFLKCIILGITVYYNINLKKLCLFSNLGKEIQKKIGIILTLISLRDLIQIFSSTSGRFVKKYILVIYFL